LAKGVKKRDAYSGKSNESTCFEAGLADSACDVEELFFVLRRVGVGGGEIFPQGSCEFFFMER
jgi:hypothetical protein